eukprot:TRINITY_DN2768_c0_g1_i7.p1 TRINITY_DN2768_c0_g1~~TRINITY_DN2768_c0_g1_i7.p1  ORF type:complete len:648 (-),score=125.40 TRINITY_DN2768_c0_g1_i7:529-2472(-)
MSTDLRLRTANAFETLVDAMDGAVVVIDQHMAEIVRWSLGLAHFLQLGPRSILDIDQVMNDKGMPALMESDEQSEPSTVVFFLSTPLHLIINKIEKVLDILDAAKCRIYTPICDRTLGRLSDGCFSISKIEDRLNAHIASLRAKAKSTSTAQTMDGLEQQDTVPYTSDHSSEETQPPEADLSKDSNRERKNSNTKSSYAKVSYFPIATAPLLDHLFVIPSVSGMSPVVFEKGTGSNHEALHYNLPKDEITAKIIGDAPENLRILSCHLNSLFHQLELRPELFALGSTSHIVAQMMEQLEKPPASYPPASLILVDRTVDLVSPCFATDNLADRIYSLLNRSTASERGEKDADSYLATDVAFMPLGHIAERVSEQGPPFSIDIHHKDTEQYTVHSCLAHPHCDKATALLAMLIQSRTKRAMADAKMALVETLVDANILPEKDLARVTNMPLSQLRNAIATALKSDDFSMKNESLLQIIIAAVAVFDGSQRVLEVIPQDRIDKWLFDASFEKVVLASLGDESTPVLGEVIRSYMVPNQDGLEEDPDIQLPRILKAASMIYSLLGSSLSDADEMDFALKLMKYSTSHSTKIFGPVVSSSNRTEYRKREEQISNFIKRLRVLKHARDCLGDFRNLSTPEIPYQSILSRLAER